MQEVAQIFSLSKSEIIQKLTELGISHECNAKKCILGAVFFEMANKMGIGFSSTIIKEIAEIFDMTKSQLKLKLDACEVVYESKDNKQVLASTLFFRLISNNEGNVSPESPTLVTSSPLCGGNGLPIEDSCHQLTEQNCDAGRPDGSQCKAISFEYSGTEPAPQALHCQVLLKQGVLQL
jgi:hypothetical protein